MIDELMNMMIQESINNDDHAKIDEDDEDARIVDNATALQDDDSMRIDDDDHDDARVDYEGDNSIFTQFKP
ncbi:hypothetical protein Tco_1325865 [Tanacetum coccineum]